MPKRGQGVRLKQFVFPAGMERRALKRPRRAFARLEARNTACENPEGML